MKTSCKSTLYPSNQSGNAMIYVLIAIVLFAALSLIVARQGDSSETSSLDAERTEIAATQLIQTSMQLKQGVDQMLYGGTQPDALDFVTPDDEPDFSTAPHVNKVFHPAGGGLILQPIPKDAVDQISTDPPARWYIGRFYNIDWTNTAAQEVILVAHQISTPVCRAINQRLLGDPTPLATTENPRNLLIDSSIHGGTNPSSWTVTACPACEDKIAACIEGPSEVSGKNVRSFYNIVVSR